MNTSLDDLLVDLHLDRLDDGERSRLTGKLACDERLAARCHALGRVLRPLDADGAAPGPSTLADRIIAATGAAPQTSSDGNGNPAPRTGRPRDLASKNRQRPPVRMSECGEAGMCGGRRFTLRDVAALAACILVIIFVVIPGAARLREEGRRTVCGDNFGYIYRAVSTYGQTFDENLPQAEFIKGGSWLYDGPAGAPRASNSRHAFLLPKLGFATDPSVFVCPSSLSAPAGVTDLAAMDDFASPDDCTYDTLNMNGPAPRLSGGSDVAYVSDPNPVFIDGVYHPSVNPNTANTPLHSGEGQNVLSLDGQVRWVTSPFVNRRDNLWLAGDRQVYRGTEGRTSAKDAFLVPATPTQTNGTPSSQQPSEELEELLGDDQR